MVHGTRSSSMSFRGEMRPEKGAKQLSRKTDSWCCMQINANRMQMNKRKIGYFVGSNEFLSIDLM